MPSKRKNSPQKIQHPIDFLTKYSTEQLLELKRQASEGKDIKQWQHAVNRILKERVIDTQKLC